MDGVVFKQFVTEPLSHTADYTDHHIRPSFFYMLEMAEMRKDPLFSMFADRAGIYQNNVSIFFACDQAEPRFFKRGTDQRRIQLIHLTSKSLYMHAWAAHRKETSASNC
jgi:hypothetical protein